MSTQEDSTVLEGAPAIQPGTVYRNVARFPRLSEAALAAANDDRAASITRLEAMLPSLSTEARARARRTIQNLREQLRGVSID